MTEDISPSIKILESNYISNLNISSTQNIALFIGEFEKGDINEPKLISSALEFKLTFGRATDSNFNDWYQVYNYLQYPGSPKIWVCRTSGNENIKANNNGNIANSPGNWGNLLTIEVYYKESYNNYLKEVFGLYNESEITEDYFIIIRRNESIVENFMLSDSVDLNSQYLEAVNMVPGVYKLSGGYSDEATLIDYRESFEIFSKENYEIDIVIAPEYYNEVVIEFVESRKDCIGFLGIPRHIFALSVKNLVSTKADYNSIVSYIESISKSQYCFMTFGFKMQIDGFSGKKRIVNVNADIAGLKALNSSIVSWGIPAGVEREVIRNAEGFTMKISKDETDKLYKLGVNTLSNGTLMTQKLFIQKEEICTRLHQRCIFNYVERAVEKLTRNYIFSQNNRNTRATVALQIKKILEDMLSSGGIEAGRVHVTSDSDNKIIINIYIRLPYIIELVNIRMFNSGTNISFINETV